MHDARDAAPADDDGVKGTTASRLLGGSLAGSLGFALSVAQAVLQVPLLLAVWPEETFAAWVGAQGLFALLTSVDVGFHAYVGSAANMIGIGRAADIRTLLSSSLRVVVALAALELAICGLLGGVELAGAGGWPREGFSPGIVPLAILCLGWAAIGSFNGLLSRIYLAYGETVRFQLFGIVLKALTFGAVVATAWCGGGVTAVAAAFALASGLVSLACVADFRRRMGAIYPRWSLGTWRSGWETLRRSLGISFAMCLEQATNGGLMAFVAWTLPAVAAAQFSTVRSLTNAVAQAAGVVMFPTVPELGRSATPATIGRAGLLIDGLLLVCVSPLAIATSGVAPWIPTLYEIWTRTALPFDPLLYLALAAAVLVRQTSLPFQLFLIATNQVHAQFTATALRAAVLAGGVAAAVGFLGAAGAALAVAASEVVFLVYVFVVARAAFRERGAVLGGFQPLAALAHVAVAAAVTVVALRGGVPPTLACGTALVAHAVLVAAQVRAAPAALRERLATLLPWRRGVGDA